MLLKPLLCIFINTIDSHDLEIREKDFLHPVLRSRNLMLKGPDCYYYKVQNSVNFYQTVLCVRKRNVSLRTHNTYFRRNMEHNSKLILLTHISLVSFLWDIGKQRIPRSDLIRVSTICSKNVLLEFELK